MQFIVYKYFQSKTETEAFKSIIGAKWKFIVKIENFLTISRTLDFVQLLYLCNKSLMLLFLYYNFIWENFVYIVWHAFTLFRPFIKYKIFDDR